MKHIFILITIGFMTFKTNVDVGTPVIQAVCKITTHDGKSVEGFITLINGSYQGMRPNGFYFYEDDHYNGIKLFDLRFRSFKNFYRNAKKVHLIMHTWGRDVSSVEKSKRVVIDSIGKHLIDKTIITHQYKMLDSVPLFQQLTRDYYLDYRNTEQNCKKIAIKDIATFEIVKTPSQEWLTRIKNAQVMFDMDNNGEDSTGDNPELFWAHDLINDPKLIEEIKRNYKDYTWY